MNSSFIAECSTINQTLHRALFNPPSKSIKRNGTAAIPPWHAEQREAQGDSGGAAGIQGSGEPADVHPALSREMDFTVDHIGHINHVEGEYFFHLSIHHYYCTGRNPIAILLNTLRNGT